VEVSRWIDEQKLIDRLVEEIELPGPFVAATLGGRNKPFEQTLAELPGAEVYSKAARR
jgi:biotin synthase-related radical SAM superfamily protein